MRPRTKSVNKNLTDNAIKIITDLNAAKGAGRVKNEDIAWEANLSNNSLSRMLSYHVDARISNVCRVADALGMELRLCEKES